MHIAAKAGNIDLVKLLLQERATINAQNNNGESPLYGALATNNNYTLARILIESGADLTNKVADGKTPLHNLFNNTISEVLTKDH